MQDALNVKNQLSTLLAFVKIAGRLNVNNVVLSLVLVGLVAALHIALIVPS